MLVHYSINTNANYGIGHIASMAVKGITAGGHKVFRIHPGLFGTKPTSDQEFDTNACKPINVFNDLDLLHVWANMGLEQITHVKRNNVPVVLDRASTHIEHQRDVLKKECSPVRFNAVFKESASRQLKEYEKADMIIVPSVYAYKTFPERMQHDEQNKLRIIPFGVDTLMFRPDPIEHDGFRALFVGANIIRKGYKYFDRAMELMSLPADRWVAGNPSLGLLGHVPYNEMPRIYNSCDVLVLPSLEEGNSMAVNEAMACGLPVIVTEECGPFPGFNAFKNYMHGITVPARDPKAIAEALDHIRYDCEDAKRMGNNARKLAEQFTWQRYGQSLCETYDELVVL